MCLLEVWCGFEDVSLDDPSTKVHSRMNKSGILCPPYTGRRHMTYLFGGQSYLIGASKIKLYCLEKKLEHVRVTMAAHYSPQSIRL